MRKTAKRASPSRPTVKRLFALSGNRCAFPRCETPLADPAAPSVVGEICHIKGEKPGAARYDANQSNDEWHGYDNLILLCGVHHKIVDDDDVAYTVERLTKMKQSHEARHRSPPSVDDATIERFVDVAISNSTVHGSVVASCSQSGGQTAHAITNIVNLGAPQPAPQAFRVATHRGTHEHVTLGDCKRYGRPVAPAWLAATPGRLGSTWLVERLTAQADLRLCFDPKWCDGIWFVVDLQRGDGVVVNPDQRDALTPPSPTTTTPPPRSGAW